MFSFLMNSNSSRQAELRRLSLGMVEVTMERMGVKREFWIS